MGADNTFSETNFNPENKKQRCVIMWNRPTIGEPAGHQSLVFDSYFNFVLISSKVFMRANLSGQIFKKQYENANAINPRT